MIVNAVAILVVLVAVIEIVTGAVLAGVTRRALRSDRACGDGSESLRQLALLLVVVLGGVALASLLLWGLLLQSYVPQWDGVQCITGVLRVGTGSTGATGWLPALADATSWLHVGFLFVAGLAVVLHTAARERPGAALTGVRATVLFATAAAAITCAGAEIAYVVIPKTGQFLAAGCCTTSSATVGVDAQTPLSSGSAVVRALPFAAVAALLCACFAVWRRVEIGTPAHVIRIGLSVAFLATGLVFVHDVVSPAVSGLPLHRCIPCLGSDAPESTFGLALLATPLFATAWRGSARWLDGPAMGDMERLSLRLDHYALGATLGAVTLFLTSWWVA